LPFILEAWKRDPFIECRKALEVLCEKHANRKGRAKLGDAVKIASQLKDDDLVFVDPPYSGVQYSRFYHVLETVARQHCSEVTGIGRYPPISERPQSAFSNKGQSLEALTNLLKNLAFVGANTILTFPKGICSNGLSGNMVMDVAHKYFRVQTKIVNGRFSTLGGNNNRRAARHDSHELILLLKPK
jgi:hypothetical protein